MGCSIYVSTMLLKRRPQGNGSCAVLEPMTTLLGWVRATLPHAGHLHGVRMVSPDQHSKKKETTLTTIWMKALKKILHIIGFSMML